MLRPIVDDVASLTEGREVAVGVVRGIVIPVRSGQSHLGPAGKAEDGGNPMSMKTLALAAALTLTVSGAAMAETAAGGGSAEGSMNNPGSVKSNSEKSMEGGAGSMVTGTMSTGTGPGTSGGPPVSTPGAAGGGSMGNGTTGSGAAPIGR